ncbi:hypothetical protein CRG98_048487 [Punica granatum]|uniref:Uncharacterized protein n=1 Tax=Punica granatum TaxID=22663 RepID=A0A2I0HHF6_PUNGR|nr:hypothetical protein CRG98_048487 [Punica granatum]
MRPCRRAHSSATMLVVSSKFIEKPEIQLPFESLIIHPPLAWPGLPLLELSVLSLKYVDGGGVQPIRICLVLPLQYVLMVAWNSATCSRVSFCKSLWSVDLLKVKEFLFFHSVRIAKQKMVPQEIPKRAGRVDLGAPLSKHRWSCYTFNKREPYKQPDTSSQSSPSYGIVAMMQMKNGRTHVSVTLALVLPPPLFLATILPRRAQFRRSILLIAKSSDVFLQGAEPRDENLKDNLVDCVKKTNRAITRYGFQRVFSFGMSVSKGRRKKKKKKKKKNNGSRSYVTVPRGQT